MKPSVHRQEARSAAATFTVVVPAHNESAVIGRTLRHMVAPGSSDERPDIIVVCNGCTDDTAAKAAVAAPDADVVELVNPSKTEAINRGLAQAGVHPVIIVDADVLVSRDTLAALATELRQEGVMAAAPVPHFETGGSDRWTKAYYRVWSRSPYLATGVGGAGVYGLSHDGVRMIGQFPSLISDDSYVRSVFPIASQRRIAQHCGQPVSATVMAPAKLSGLLACEIRWQAGNLELRARSAPSMIERGSVREPSRASLVDLAIYNVIKIVARALYLRHRLTGTHVRWHRADR